ncbi:MAG: O-succinylhomoserine sulfhydrylase [Gammaproteobacteria bacterium]|nr:O-succinylhomoserine sulfhydrylase [Gammaproteobacteria bacterium]
MDKDKEPRQRETEAVRAGHHRTAEGEHSEPLFITSSYVFANAEEAAARFAGRERGNIYSRNGNPTVRIFEERLAALEGAERALATASGMSAILAVCLGLLRAGDHIVASQSLFGPTVALLQMLARFGIDTTFVALDDVDAWRRACTKHTRLFFLETPSNPLSVLGDIVALADVAHAAGARLVVDNSFCTPILQQPLALGADLVIHSATKYIDGQGRGLGGAIVGSEALIGGDIFLFVRTAGPVMSPFNAWIFLKGLETLPLRMEAHSARALSLSLWLEDQPLVEEVFYSHLPSHPQYALARAQQSAGGGVLAFRLRGGRKEAFAFIDASRIMSITANLGDTKTTITHPATTTHGRLTPEARAAAGVGDELIRISVGLESLEDLKRDLEGGFAAVRACG